MVKEPGPVAVVEDVWVAVIPRLDMETANRTTVDNTASHGQTLHPEAMFQQGNPFSGAGGPPAMATERPITSGFNSSGPGPTTRQCRPWDKPKHFPKVGHG